MFLCWLDDLIYHSAINISVCNMVSQEHWRRLIWMIVEHWGRLWSGWNKGPMTSMVESLSGNLFESSERLRSWWWKHMSMQVSGMLHAVSLLANGLSQSFLVTLTGSKHQADTIASPKSLLKIIGLCGVMTHLTRWSARTVCLWCITCPTSVHQKVW